MKRFLLFIILLAFSAQTYSASWTKIKYGWRLALICNDVEHNNTWAALDSSVVKFDTTGTEWFIDIYDADGNLVWKTYSDGSQRIYDGTDSLFASPGALILDSGGDEDLGLTVKNGAGAFTKLFPDSSNFQSSAMVITNEGRVGIGESSPDRVFHVNSGSAGVGIKLESTTANCKIELIDPDNQVTINSVSNGLKLYVGADNDEFFLTATGKLGLGTTDPDDYVTVLASSPVLTLTDSDVNLNTSTSAQQQDSSAIVLDASLTEPLIKRTTSTGLNIRTPNVYEGWVTHEADTVILGAVPANYFVSQVFVWVQEEFDSDAADNLTIGYDGDSDAYATTIDVSSTGVKSVTLGGSGRIIDATGRTVKAYYDDAGSDATTGEVHIYIEWIQGTANP